MTKLDATISGASGVTTIVPIDTISVALSTATAVIAARLLSSNICAMR
jgi:hypothetical protein